MVPTYAPDDRKPNPVWLSARRPTALILGVCAAASAILIAVAVAPSLDIDLARFALQRPGGVTAELLSALRPYERFAPAILLCVLIVVETARARVRRTARAAVVRRLLFLAGTLVLGPGLLVNGVLEAHSHRPRPVQTIEVAGVGAPFRPFTAFDGACRRNCSFSSGEAAGAFWTVAPALLTPSSAALPAVALAMSFGVGVGAMRIAAGAHFLSDVAFSALSTLLIVLFAHRLLNQASPASRRRLASASDATIVRPPNRPPTPTETRNV